MIELDKETDAIEGRNQTIKCRVSGKPAAKIVWFKNGTTLKNMPSYAVIGRLNDNTYESVSTLIFAPVKREDNGNYGCQAINHYGNATKNVKLNLLCKYRTVNIKLGSYMQMLLVKKTKCCFKQFILDHVITPLLWLMFTKCKLF